MWSLAQPWIGSIDELMQIERWFGAGDPEELVARYDSALSALESTEVDDWLEEAGRAGVTHLSMRHFKADWLDGSAVPLARDAMVERFRTGFGAALNDARSNGLPTSIVWVMLGEGDESFAVSHVVGANAVTVVISVPIGTVDPEQAQ